MKNLKPILKACSLILLLAFASCKKDGGVKPEVKVNTPITTADLLAYSIDITLGSELGLRVIYFNKDGNDIKATLDGITFRKIYTVNLVNNTWILDQLGDGTVTYTFTFAKDDKGQLIMANAIYKKQSDASIEMQLVMTKNADVPSFANTRFRNSENPTTYMKFSNDHNFAISNKSDYAGAGWSSYYDLCAGAWKGMYNGVNYMGFSIVQNGILIMIVQKAGTADYYLLGPL
ncbi:hypothetical protein ABIB62_002980 [Mucilaginibacter sp. UYP25]|uniref:hypothetical protein n=1 Tax=unclassified Mucilaginibacter TaxID=2617802 RepID=UPI00339A09AB